MDDWPDRPQDLSRWILDQRSPKNSLDARRAYGAFVEQEPDAAGRLREVATLLLTNRECAFRCLMCDLWKNTLDDPTPRSAISEQIRSALANLPQAEVIKLYNAGNFFDAGAIPREDWPEIAERVAPFERVIIESHPKMIDDRAKEFRDLLSGRLEVAIGLETVQEEVLERLNKQMTLAEFERSVRFCRDNEIDVRACSLLRPPCVGEAEGVEWCKRSIAFAFSVGVQCCAVVPTRAGNGALDQLQRQGLFEPPSLRSLEEVLTYGLSLGRGRVFVDLWNVEMFFDCPRCGPARAERLKHMNLSQAVSTQLSAVSFQLSAVSGQRSAVSCEVCV